MGSNNYWQIAGPVFVILMALLGWMRCTPGRECIRERFYGEWLPAIGTLLAAAFTVMVVYESHDGITQFLLDSVRNDESPLYAFLFWPFVVAGVGIAATWSLAFVGMAADKVKWHLCRYSLLERKFRQQC